MTDKPEQTLTHADTHTSLSIGRVNYKWSVSQAAVSNRMKQKKQNQKKVKKKNVIFK